ncbi:MAG TPA: hypothetical protein VM097_00060 [Mycobacteriales bacterium]|nr:hypothetical protein [Mycobacteriales bacterium]
MSNGEGTPGRRLRLVPVRRPSEPDVPPRVEALDALLREVDDLRLTLETDLTLAASAVESGKPGIAAEILGADRVALHSFEERALDHLSELESPRRHRLWAQVHAAPIVAAAALVGVLVGVVPQALGPRTDGGQSTVAADSLYRIQELAENGSTDEVRAASAQLHRQLAGVVANAESDPAAAQTALLLLTYEQSAIVRSGDSRALADVLRQSQALAAAIVAALPSKRTSVPRLAPVVTEPTSAPRPTASPTASPKAKPTASPTAAPSASPTSSPTASKDPAPNPIPSAPIAP